MVGLLYWGHYIDHLNDVIYTIIIIALAALYVHQTKRLKLVKGYARNEGQENVELQNKVNKLRSKYYKAQWHWKYYRKHLEREGILLDHKRQWKKHLKKKFPYG